MPNTNFARKRDKQNERNRLRNVAIKSRIKTTEKTCLSCLSSEEELKKNLSLYYKYVDKAIGKGVIKKNTGARKKSRLVLRVRRLQSVSQ